MGRPTFKISEQRLRSLRLETGKTQLTIATELRALLGITHPSTDRTLISDYQRIERTGRTSKKTALALATLYQVSVEVLQGLENPEPIDFLSRIATLLRSQLDKGENRSLQNALTRCADSEAPSESSFGEFVEQIGERIEALLLGRNPAEINELVELTGLPESELLKPANVLGHWLLLVSSRICNRSEIVHGASSVCWHIKDVVADSPNRWGSDCSIRMLRDAPWFRIEIVGSVSRHDVMRIDAVRCHPDANGLRWMPASWREQLWFEEPLVDWAYSAANFVTNFDGVQSPCDLRNLRLIVTEHEGSYITSIRKMVITGRLDEIPETTMVNFQREGSSHSLVLNWLSVDLRQSISRHLAEYPPECWDVSRGACIDIKLTPPRTSNRFASPIPPGVRYRITLAEAIVPHQFVNVPWRDKDMESLRQDIERWLHEPLTQWVDAESTNDFEPI